MDQHLHLSRSETAAPVDDLVPAAQDGLWVARERELDGALLRDAAAVLSARRDLDALLAQLAAQPFSAAAYGGLRAWLAGPADRALAAYQRLCTSTTVRGR